MDSWRLKPARLTMEKIREATEEFRKDHIFTDTLPVEIERVIEATMGITIIPIKSLLKDCDMDGFISLDFKSIYVDQDLYMDDRYYKRVRFTIAHEIGHMVLHRSGIDQLKFETEKEWMSFRNRLKDDDLGWFETQASEFAGRLLVPKDHLIEVFTRARTEVQKRYRSWNAPSLSNDELFSVVAPKICAIFDVSAEVIERRLRKVNIMDLIE